MPSELQLADDYAEALDTIASRATENTTRALARSMLRTLKQLRKFYGQFIDPDLPATKSADGVTRRPGSYSIADSSAKFKELMRISQDFFPEKQLKILQQRFIQDFTDAVALGGELGQELAQEVDPEGKTRAPFVGASRAAVEAAAKTASAYIRGEVESFRDNIARIVTDGIGRGKGPRALEKDIRIALQGAKDPDGLNAKMGLKQRAELIARSELANAYVGAQKAAAARNGYTYLRWIATKDERTCPVCASRHGKIYRIDDVVGTAHPRCVLGDTLISPGPIAASFRSMYCGDVVTISLEDGSIFTVTAQHPVLTHRGIKHAELLRNGDQLIGNNPDVLPKNPGNCPDLHQVPARAEDVFAAFAKSGSVTTVSMPVSPLDLHGDGGSIKGEINVVRAAGLLQGYWESAPNHEIAEDASLNPRVRFRPFSALSLADAAVFGLGAAACGSVSSLREAQSLLRGGLSHAEEHRIAAAAWGDSSLTKPVNDDGATYAKMASQCFDAHPGLVQAHKIVNIKRNPFVGHVYTFESFSGFYSMGVQTRIVNQNCRCALSPVSADAVEEKDPEFRRQLLRQDYWDNARATMLNQFAEGKGKKVDGKLIPMEFGKASKILEEAIKKPSPSERRQYPGMERAPEPVA